MMLAAALMVVMAASTVNGDSIGRVNYDLNIYGPEEIVNLTIPSEMRIENGARSKAVQDAESPDGVIEPEEPEKEIIKTGGEGMTDTRSKISDHKSSGSSDGVIEPEEPEKDIVNSGGEEITDTRSKIPDHKSSGSSDGVVEPEEPEKDIVNSGGEDLTDTRSKNSDQSAGFPRGGMKADPQEKDSTASSGACTDKCKFVVRNFELNLGVASGQKSDIIEEEDTKKRAGGSGSGMLSRKGVMSDDALWPKTDGVPIVKYTIGLTHVPKALIEEAVAHYEEHTCLKFEEVGWFHFSPHIGFGFGSGCSSAIGYNAIPFSLGQGISLGFGCEKFHVIVHEIGHAIGLFHEQSRSDSGGYVKVNNWNIEFGGWSQFNRRDTRNFNTLYDYTSIMQYGPLSFSWNGRTTIAATDPMAQGLMLLARQGLSFMDKLQINQLYGCSDYWLSQCPGLPASPCQNRGYLGRDCACVCPAGTLGLNCEVQTKSYTDALIEQYLPLNERVTSPTVITSPNFPTPQQDSVIFTKVIQAPVCQKVVLTVDAFEMAARNLFDGFRCTDEGVEITRNDEVTSGRWYCGKELKEGKVIESYDSKLVVFYFKGRSDSNTKKGFKFDITFEPIGGCSV